MFLFLSCAAHSHTLAQHARHAMRIELPPWWTTRALLIVPLLLLRARVASTGPCAR